MQHPCGCPAAGPHLHGLGNASKAALDAPVQPGIQYSAYCVATFFYFPKLAVLQKCVGEGCEIESLLVLGWKQETPSVILVWSVIVAKSRAVNPANACMAKGIYLTGL